jgi:Alpha/beta hydrolase domain
MALLRFGCALIAAAATCASYGVQAEVTRVEIASRTDVLGGKPFGASGAYEKIVGKVFFSVDPAHPRNKAIVDLDKAPRDADGRVTFSADLYVLAPKDAARGNGVAFFDVLNRGRKNILGDFNRAPTVPDPTAEGDFGDGFLMRQGYTLVWVGWQFDIPRRSGLMALDAPLALDQGKPITGWVSTTFTPNTAEETYALDDMGRYADTTRYPPLDPASPANTLTVRDGFLGAPRTIARDQWQFGRMRDGQLVPDISALYLKGGYEPGHFYELSYEAKGAVVAGLGFAALRDMASAVKHQQGGPIAARYAYAFGRSQDGRFLRQFFYEGFNADEQDRRAFDGVISHIAGSARSGDFNSRFARPNGLAFFVASLFPYLDLDQYDPVTGKNDGILMKLGPDQRPKIFYTNAAPPRSSTRRSMAATTPKCRTTSASIWSPERSTFQAVTCRRKGRVSRSRTATNTRGLSARCSSQWIAGCATALPRRPVRIRGLRTRRLCRATASIFRRSRECAHR